MELYQEYIKERLGKDVLIEENAFAVFYFTEDGCMIEDIYVRPEFRKAGYAALLADKIAIIAKERGVKYLYGSVVPSANNSNTSLKVLLAYGFELFNCSNNFIVFRKEI